jgi:hypothetical protein
MIEILFLFGLVEHEYNQTIYHFPVKNTLHFFKYEDKKIKDLKGKKYDLLPWYRYGTS